MVWAAAVVLVLVWAIGKAFHHGGAIHILLICALSLVVVEIVAKRRAAG
jgi:hypothetical protein